MAPLTTKDTDQPALTLGFEFPTRAKAINGPHDQSYQGHLLLRSIR